MGDSDVARAFADMGLRQFVSLFGGVEPVFVPHGVVAGGDDGFAGECAFYGVAVDCQCVVDFGFVVAEQNGFVLDGFALGIFVGGEVFDGVVADFVNAVALAVQIAQFFVGLDGDGLVELVVGIPFYAGAGVAVVAVVLADAVGRVLDDGVVADGDAIHGELAVIYLDARLVVAFQRVVFNHDVVAVVCIQPFAVVVFGVVAGVAHAEVVAAGHGGGTVACAAVAAVAVGFQIVVFGGEVALEAYHHACHAVVVQIALAHAVVVTDGEGGVVFADFVVNQAGFVG